MKETNRLKIELENDIYDVINEGIKETIKKYGYKKYDIAKLVMALYQKNYDFIIRDSDYRDQIQLLDEYFASKFNHKLITFIILKTIISYKNSDKYNEIVLNIVSMYTMISHDQKPDLQDFFSQIDNEKYEEVIDKIENDKNIRFALAIVYDRLLSQDK